MVGVRVRAALHAAALDHTPDIGQVTISIGAASLVPSVGEPPSTLVECADRALYEAKRAGRDRVVTHGRQDDAPGGDVV
jgi:two-component system chemotaxis family response regulator WspR